MALIRRLLLWLAQISCAGHKFCNPFTQHSDHSIRLVCLTCGKKGPWHRVIGPF